PYFGHDLGSIHLNVPRVLANCIGDLIVRDTAHVASTAPTFVLYYTESISSTTRVNSPKSLVKSITLSKFESTSRCVRSSVASLCNAFAIVSAVRPLPPMTSTG